MGRNIRPGGAEARMIGDKSRDQLSEEADQFGADVDLIREALLRRVVAGSDIGEVVYMALRDAQIELAPGHHMLDNRPGSWEAAGLMDLMSNALTEIQYLRKEGLLDADK
jgi:hypothetical protein